MDVPLAARIGRQGVHADPAASGFMQHDALWELARLFDPQPSIPVRLYCGTPHIGKSARLAQILFGAARLVELALRRKTVAIIHGPGLPYRSGWVDITSEHVWQSAARSALRLQPCVPLAVAANAAEHLTRLGLDPAGLRALLSHNDHLVFKARHNGRPCVVHYGASADCRDTVVRHANGLSGARADLGATIGAMLPTIGRSVADARCAICIQQMLDGVAAPARFADSESVAPFVQACMIPLTQIWQTHAAQGQWFGRHFIDMELGRLPGVLPEYQVLLKRAVAQLGAWASAGRRPAVPTHGDYAPRNLLFEPGYARVCGIIDWEWYWNDGIIGFDPLKLLLEIEAMQQGTTIINTLADALRTRCASPFLQHHLGSLVAAHHITTEDIWHIVLLIWLRILWMGCVVTRPVSRAWLDNAVQAPMQAIEASGWLAA
jgi:hypothetical protein